LVDRPPLRCARIGTRVNALLVRTPHERFERPEHRGAAAGEELPGERVELRIRHDRRRRLCGWVSHPPAR